MYSTENHPNNVARKTGGRQRLDTLAQKTRRFRVHRLSLRPSRRKGSNRPWPRLSVAKPVGYAMEISRGSRQEEGRALTARDRSKE
ncbi:hypothetical protein GCM10009530_26090 [Microbispora corallina]|uniref:Uncharacterized protein n=1 Tax=Microbispora corallina TaxID=83302 RepID=A0ABQ4G4U3_9ACTN|nr:hypothetical protein Mco01_50910 [Microbispora corallina]